MNLKPLRTACLVALLPMLGSGCAQLSFAIANVPAAFGDYSRLADLRYGRASRNQLDVYLPNRQHIPAEGAPNCAGHCRR